jgi:hypothetical protein
MRRGAQSKVCQVTHRGIFVSPFAEMTTATAGNRPLHGAPPSYTLHACMAWCLGTGATLHLPSQLAQKPVAGLFGILKAGYFCTS